MFMLRLAFFILCVGMVGLGGCSRAVGHRQYTPAEARHITVADTSLLVFGPATPDSVIPTVGTVVHLPCGFTGRVVEVIPWQGTLVRTTRAGLNRD